jgi:hypothetical protein
MSKPLRKIFRSKSSRNSAETTRSLPSDNAGATTQASNTRADPRSASLSETAATFAVRLLTGINTNTDRRSTETPPVLITVPLEDDEIHASQRSDLMPQHIPTPPRSEQSVSCECLAKMQSWIARTDSPLLVRKDASFRVLCIDGGGYCCLSAILTLTHLLGTVNHGKSDTSPRPCEHFDLICGVGSGGLVAILFGVLEMRCDEAMDAYVHLGRLAFEEEEVDGKVLIAPRGRDRHEFRKELERLVEKHLQKKGAVMNSARRRTLCRVSCLTHARMVRSD